MKRDWRKREFRKMVTLGESITAGGWSSSRELCWASQLAELISEFQNEPVHLINSGIGANLISTRSPGYSLSGKPAASERIEKHVIAHNPDLVIISYGLNDARGGTPQALFREEMVSIINRIRKECPPLIVLLVPYYMTDFNLGGETWGHANLDIFKQFNCLIAEVAKSSDCLFADVLSANGETDWMVHYDGCHANDLGHRIIANRIFEVLAQNCSCISLKTKELEKTSPRWRDESTLQSDYGY